MSVPQRMIREWEASQGVDRLGPIVTFYDHALPDDEATKQSGRPRFKHAVFIRMVTQNDPTGSTFCREAKDEDKQQFPKEWAQYEELKAQVDTRAPSIKAIPGMDAVALEELKALDIVNCKQLAEYEGDLSPINHLRQIAQQIMEIDNEAHRGIRGQRESVPENLDGRTNGQQSGTDWAGGGAFTARAGSASDRSAGRVPSNNQGRQPVPERPEGGQQLLRGSPVEVFHYEMVPVK